MLGGLLRGEKEARVTAQSPGAPGRAANPLFLADSWPLLDSLVECLPGILAVLGSIPGSTKERGGVFCFTVDLIVNHRFAVEFFFV